MDAMIEEKGFQKKTALCLAGYLLLLFAFGVGMLRFEYRILLDRTLDGKSAAISACFGLLCALYSWREQKRLFSRLRNVLLALAFFLLSALLLLLGDLYVNVPVWLIGGILTAALLDRNLGMLYVYFFVYQAIWLEGSTAGALALHFFVATLLCVFLPKIKTGLSMVYLMVCSNACVIAISVVVNRMVLDGARFLDALYILAIYDVCIVLAVLLRRLFCGKAAETPETDYGYLERLASETAYVSAEPVVGSSVPEEASTEESALAQEASLRDEEEAAGALKEAPVLDFSAYCDEKTPELLEWKKNSKAAYAHSLLVSKLSAQAAESIGGNVSLAQAAGLYHEFFAEWLPEPLQAVVAECAAAKKMTSREAGVVLLTDKVLTTYTFLRGNKKDTRPERIVDNTIGMYLMNGTLNDSGLSVSDCAVLRDFFVGQLTRQDNKRRTLA